MSFDFVTTYSFHLKISHSVPYLDHKKCDDLRYIECEQKKILQGFHFKVYIKLEPFGYYVHFFSRKI